MYKLLLILRYLRRKIAPMFALLAVTLCTAMVIIVISVMGGFLQMMSQAAHKLSGDITVQSDLTGFAHYQELIDELKKLPQVAEATPVLRAYGLVKMRGITKAVELEGIRPTQYNAVTTYEDALYWQTQDRLRVLEQQAPPPEQLSPEGLARIESLRQRYREEDLRAIGMSLTPPSAWLGPDYPKAMRGIVPGIEVSPYNFRDRQGKYDFMNSSLGVEATVTVLPLTQAGAIKNLEVARLMVVNEFKSGLYEIDANRAYVPFEVLQELLGMDEAEAIDPDTGEVTGQKIPARTSEVILRGAPGVGLMNLRDAVRAVVQQFLEKHRDDVVHLQVLTWKDRHATLLGAVEREKIMVTVLFAIVSVVAFAMIAVILYMIVLEKTRDIGTLRALGASPAGVATIFLGYGLAIGVVGAVLGAAIATQFVWRINDLQDFLSHSLGVALLYLGCAAAGLLLGAVVGGFIGAKRGRFARYTLTAAGVLMAVGVATAYALLATRSDLGPTLNARYGFTMWNPQVYYFDRIPAIVDPSEVAVIMLAAVAASVLGGVIPAFFASMVDPVESLRYE